MQHPGHLYIPKINQIPDRTPYQAYHLELLITPQVPFRNPRIYRMHAVLSQCQLPSQGMEIEVFRDRKSQRHQYLF